MSASNGALAVIESAAVQLHNEGFIILAPKVQDAYHAVAELMESVRPAITDEGMSQHELNRLRTAFARAGGAA